MPDRSRLDPGRLAAAAALLALAAAGPVFAAPPRASAAGSEDPVLDAALRGAGEYCRRLEKSILDFFCREGVSERIRLVAPGSAPAPKDWAFLDPGLNAKIARGIPPVPPAATLKRRWTYDYQYVRKAGQVREHRTLLEVDGRRCLEPETGLRTTSLRYSNALLGPVTLFADRYRGAYAFRALRKERFAGRTATVIGVSPRPGGPPQPCLSGTAWVDGASGEILGLEWVQAPHDRLDVFAAREAALGGVLRLTMRTEFRAEKNGLRFPSRLRIEEAYVRPRGRAFVRSVTEVAYTGFRFFTVEVDVR